MEVKEFKIRCSAIGDIMAGEIGLTEKQEADLNELQSRKENHKNGVDKVKPLTTNMEKQLENLIFKRDNPELPEGAKTYCKKWLKKTLFKRKEEWKSIVIDKGLACEKDGIKLIAEVYEIDDLHKNEDQFVNDFMEGSPDMLTMKKVRDSKLSWDLYSFPMFEDEIPEKKYWWQLQGYMILTGLKEAALDYVLIDTPMPLVLLDLKKLYYQSGGVAEEWSQEKYEFLYPNYRFDDIPKNMRIKTFEFEYEERVYNEIKYRVELCRNYIKTLLPSE